MITFKLDSKITFGKYSTKELPVALTIQEIIDTDPDWVAWAADEIKWFELDEDAIEAVDQALFEQDDGELYYKDFNKELWD